MSRRNLREHCFKLLFCISFHSKEEYDEQIESYMNQIEEIEEIEENSKNKKEVVHRVNLSKEDEQVVKDRVEDILLHLKEIDEVLSKATLNWKLERLGKVALTILRIACYELNYDEDVPEKVAANEAVEIAKKFGGDDSFGFINGILAKVIELSKTDTKEA